MMKGFLNLLWRKFKAALRNEGLPAFAGSVTERSWRELLGRCHSVSVSFDMKGWDFVQTWVRKFGYGASRNCNSISIRPVEELCEVICLLKHQVSIRSSIFKRGFLSSFALCSVPKLKFRLALADLMGLFLNRDFWLWLYHFIMQ